LILILDAHALLWWLADDATLDPGARSMIADPANDVLISAASVWEIEIKRALGTLAAPEGLIDAIEASAFDTLPITAGDAELAGRLPPHHRDPFDRMLVAQATRLDAVIITRDESFAAYGVDVLAA
jgi:PIN domain nuclease of toxin-antitoxin system